MRSLRPTQRLLAVVLAGLAGYVDAIGFLHLGGLFVSFMSGNSTRFAASLALGDWTTVVSAATILGLFVVGAALGALAAGNEDHRAPGRVLAFEAALLAGAAAAALADMPWAAVGLMVLAMAVENAVFLRGGETAVSLTYMTGALVKLGQSLAAALKGGDPLGFVPHLALWAGLTGGAVLGAVSHGVLGLQALWPAAAAALAGALGIRPSARTS